ncbi:MAG: paraquat-inducible protein A [Deltaproteobacteria bacterium]|nr:MAG: paraquat-inducible protein A [Deltaproteobacteria bacterium]
MKTTETIACHECDLLYELPALPEGSVARCSRCGAVLQRHKRDSLDRTLAWTIAGLILFVVANAFPFLALKSGGLVRETTLITGILELYQQDMRSVAVLVFLTVILFPVVQLAGMLYLLLPLKVNRLPWWKPAYVFRFIRTLQPWAMMEVFMIGILVSMVKLAKMAKVIPGIAIYSFAVLIIALAAAAASLDPHLVWDRLELDK